MFSGFRRVGCGQEKRRGKTRTVPLLPPVADRWVALQPFVRTSGQPPHQPPKGTHVSPEHQERYHLHRHWRSHERGWLQGVDRYRHLQRHDYRDSGDSSADGQAVVKPWQEYAAEAEAALEDAAAHDAQGHTAIGTRRREEAAVLSNLAVVALLAVE